MAGFLHGLSLSVTSIRQSVNLPLPSPHHHYSPGLSEGNRGETKSDDLLSWFLPDRPTDGHSMS